MKTATFSGKKLKELMESRNMDVKHLEHKIFELGHHGISHQIISNWIDGRFNPSMKYLEALSSVFKVPMETFTQV